MTENKLPDGVRELLASGGTTVTDYDDDSGEFRLAVRGIVKDGKPRLGLGCGPTFEAAWGDVLTFVAEN
jgi:hypothetical protein